ncbi:MAG: hypothetical protein ASARMPREDX12_002983 [Alectoria sarmentosa]|nr:MAG: hypothetical protein ASARMPRED_005044 [Alectoria sarmentosa]CAD6587729.1 MAG: hypothetical protein ASARMPREDX12_002983 [Alectoria sarmentosa]
MAPAFLAQLLSVPDTDILDGPCIICHDPYSPSDHAVRLPCSHIVGFACISHWLRADTLNNTCPMCRHALFPKLPPSSSTSLPSIPYGVPAPVRTTDPASDDGLFGNWEAVAQHLDTALWRNRFATNSRSYRDFLLYSHLRAHFLDNRLPPLHVGQGPRLDFKQEEALFWELARRGAFYGNGPEWAWRDQWERERNVGYSWDPVGGRLGHGGWVQEMGWWRALGARASGREER